MRHNQQALLIDGHLDIVVLVKTVIGAVLHDARVRVGEVVLIFVLRALLPAAWAGVHPVCARLRRAFSSRSRSLASYSAFSAA